MTFSPAVVSARHTAPAAPHADVRYRERWLYGRYDEFIFEGCLEATLTEQELVLRPQAWAASAPPLTLPLAQVVCVYIHQDQWTPRLELLYRAQGGHGMVWLSPRNLRAWAQHLEGAGVLLRPITLEVDALPTRCWNALARPAAAAILASAALGGVVAAALRLSGLA